MKRLQLVDEPFDRFEMEDSARIVRALATQDIAASQLEAYLLRKAYSGSLCAQWMMLPGTDENILQCIEPYYEVVDTHEEWR